VGTRIPLDYNPNHVDLDIDRDSVEDASVTYEYIKEAALGSYTVNYLSSTTNCPATVLHREQAPGGSAWWKSLLSFGGSTDRYMYYVAVDERDDFKTLPCNLQDESSEVQRGLLEEFSIFSSDMSDLKPGDRVLVDYAVGPNNTPQSYGYITQKLSGKVTLPTSETECNVLQDRFESSEPVQLDDLESPPDTDVSGQPIGNGNGPPVDEGRYRTDFGPVDPSAFRQGVRVSSEFGLRTPPPTANESQGSSDHRGIDLATPIGLPIYAVTAATVTWSAPQPGGGGAGEYIALTWQNDGNRYRALYFHLRQENGRLVSQGDQVRPGQHIGYTGNTGNSSGPHLHFEIEVNGRKLNPREYVPLDALPEQRAMA